MIVVLFIIILLASLGVFTLPKHYKFYFNVIVQSALIAITTYWAISAFNSKGMFELTCGFTNLKLRIDLLSAFFIIVINLTSLTGLLFSHGYLKKYVLTKSKLGLSIHYFSYFWLHASMLLVTMLQNGLAFLVVWEMMSVSSFLLILFNGQSKLVLKTAVNYLIQMHIGMFLILTGFLILGKFTGNMDFSSLRLYFVQQNNIPLFLIFFVGFGIKAGFIPLHTWLPDAHPAAPSHVSGLMSGIMIKMGIYGILRVLIHVQQDLLFIGIFILGLSLVSGIWAISYAIVQRELKRLLAYSSIENVSIIGIGIGLGTIGLATNNVQLTILGFTGGLLHVLNHSLFKSLLFYATGSVQNQCHTLNLDHLGGLIKKMPKTAMLFLLGSLAICGLPPFNGFISEYLIFTGMFKSLFSSNLYLSIIFIAAIIGLAIIGGLAIFCFTKAFGIVFLGSPRTMIVNEAEEVSNEQLMPQFLIAFLIIAIGVCSSFLVEPIINIVLNRFNLPNGTFPHKITMNLFQVNMISGFFILLTIFLLWFRKMNLKQKTISLGPAWGCGYTAITSKQQYTSTSYADNYNQFTNQLANVNQNYLPIEEDEIFPQKRTFETSNHDAFKRKLINRPVEIILAIFKRIAFMQTGKVEHYVLYAFVFMILVYALSFFNLL